MRSPCSARRMFYGSEEGCAFTEGHAIPHDWKPLEYLRQAGWLEQPGPSEAGRALAVLREGLENLLKEYSEPVHTVRVGTDAVWLNGWLAARDLFRQQLCAVLGGVPTSALPTPTEETRGFFDEPTPLGKAPRPWDRRCQAISNSGARCDQRLNHAGVHEGWMPDDHRVGWNYETPASALREACEGLVREWRDIPMDGTHQGKAGVLALHICADDLARVLRGGT